MAQKKTIRKAPAKKPTTKKCATKKTNTKKCTTKKPAATKAKSTSKSPPKRTCRKTTSASSKTISSKKKSARAGEMWAINTKSAKGHSGPITKKKHNGIMEAHTVTHHKKTAGKKNIKLVENPNPKDKKTSYIVKKKHKLTSKQLGKKQTNMQIKNTTDKAVVRHLKKVDKKIKK